MMKSVKIQCVLERKGGTLVELDGERYHFKPSDNDPRHICEISDSKHVAKLVAIPEAYVMLLGDDVKYSPEEPEQAKAEEEAQAHSDEQETQNTTDEVAGNKDESDNEQPQAEEAKKTPRKRAAKKASQSN